MTISTEQREARRSWVGSSDLAAIMGYDPWRNAYDVWLEKTGRLEDRELDSDAVTAGDICEPGLLDYAERTLGIIERNAHRARLDFYLGCNLDGEVCETREVVEAKSSMLFSAGFGHEKTAWGEFGTGDVPERVVIQCHAHMACNGGPVAHVPAIIGHRGVGIYHIERNEELCELCCASAFRFWAEYVLADVPPEDVRPSMESLKRIKRLPPPHSVTVPPELVVRYRETNRARLDAEKAEDAVKKTLVLALGDAELGESSEGVVTYKQQVGAWKYDAESMRADGYFEKYASRNPFRVLRVSKGE